MLEELKPVPCRIYSTLTVVRTTIEYLKKNKMILYKEHPSISVEEAMKLLESDEEV